MRGLASWVVWNFTWVGEAVGIYARGLWVQRGVKYWQEVRVVRMGLGDPRGSHLWQPQVPRVVGRTHEVCAWVAAGRLIQWCCCVPSLRPVRLGTMQCEARGAQPEQFPSPKLSQGTFVIVRRHGWLSQLREEAADLQWEEARDAAKTSYRVQAGPHNKELWGPYCQQYIQYICQYTD